MNKILIIMFLYFLFFYRDDETVTYVPPSSQNSTGINIQLHSSLIQLGANNITKGKRKLHLLNKLGRYILN